MAPFPSFFYYLCVFLHRQSLCNRGAASLQSKSLNIENAVHELVVMLCDGQQAAAETDEDETDEEDADSPGEIYSITDLTVTFWLSW
jgi:hypothetical protein